MSDRPPAQALADLAYHHGWQVLRQWMQSRQERYEREALKALEDGNFEQAQLNSLRARTYKEIIAHVDVHRKM